MFSVFRGFPSQFSAKLEPVCDREENGFDPIVIGEFVIECVDGASAGFGDWAVTETAAPEHVIEQNNAVGPHARQKEFVVSVVLGFRGVDKNEVEGESGFKFLQLRNGRSEAELDSLIDASPGPVFLGDVSPLFTFIDADEATVLRQAASDANGTVARECADFDGRFGADCRDEEAHERALFLADLHFADITESIGLAAKCLQDSVGRVAAAVDKVAVEPVGEPNVFKFHRGCVKRNA